MLIALVVTCFGMAAGLTSRFEAYDDANGGRKNVFQTILGSSSRIFANSFYVKADEYYHSGYYPTIFNETKAFQTPHMAADTGAVASRNEGEEKGFMGPPHDWLEAFGRNFIPNRHTHLDEGGPADDLSNSKDVQEILPWLKFSAELDPDNIETYLVTAYWLRTKMNRVSEAEAVLREGLRHQPGDPQLLYELGRVYYESRHNLAQARSVWEAASRSVTKQSAARPGALQNDPDTRFIYGEIQRHLAQLEEDNGRLDLAIEHWQQDKLVSPQPAEVQKRIDDLIRRQAESTDKSGNTRSEPLPNK